MRITFKPVAKKISLLILSVFAALLFFGCYDLGKFDDTEDYYNSFGSVRLIDQSAGKNFKDYSFADYFYNEKSVNEFGGDIVDKNEYIYMILPVRSSFVLSEFTVFLNPERNGTVRFSLYISDFIPENIRRYDDPETKIKTDDDGNPVYDDNGNVITEVIQYDDLSDDDCVYRGGSVDLFGDKWDSFTVKLSDGKTAEENKLYVNDGEYIVVKFENNGGSGKDLGYEKMSFSLTNLLIRAV